MKIQKEEIRSILFITLSNLGDIILTTPVLEKLCDEFPEARVDVITGAPGEEVFRHHGAVREVVVRGKRRGLKKRMRETLDLRRKKYDLVVDLKNSLIPYLVGARFHSRLFMFPVNKRGKNTGHKRAEHLSKLASLGIDPFLNIRFFIPVTDEDKSYVSGIMDSEAEGRAVVINPGAKSHLKRWDVVKYARLADRLTAELGCRVFLTGNEDDMEIVRQVTSRMTADFTDLCCKTSIGALSELMRRTDLVITNDSAPLHVASAADVPTIAIFGPSDEKEYGPLAKKSVVIKPEVPCRPCGRALCATGPDEGCISWVTVDEVFDAAKKILT
ncbi:MAG: glycosyltransferase family 9 protein [Candidatus Omnitrophota bacterium]